jgi:hypothetical protein
MPAAAISAPAVTTARAPARARALPRSTDIARNGALSGIRRQPGAQRRPVLQVLEVRRDVKNMPVSERYTRKKTVLADAKRRARSSPSRTIGAATRRSHPERRQEEHGRHQRHPDEADAHDARLVSIKAEREQEQPARCEQRADRVERARVRIARLADPHGREREAGDADRHVHPEDRRPGEGVQQDAAQDGSHPEPETRHGRPGADRARAALGRKGVDEDREGERRHERAADALERPRDDELGVGARECAQRRAGGENREADEVDPLATVAIAERAADEDQRRQREGVSADHPFEVARRDVQIALDRGSATFTIVTSSRIIPWAMHMATSVSPGRGPCAASIGPERSGAGPRVASRAHSS